MGRGEGMRKLIVYMMGAKEWKKLIGWRTIGESHIRGGAIRGVGIDGGGEECQWEREEEGREELEEAGAWGGIGRNAGG